ncbi:hypothetical protein K470DRAFT_279065 [Piedraia hortae CBS 480.64]|uniref:Uncharacterized protein n=1 Tax=Piedraia hortae CBS 480.64 TaxID=1314780 RepID=A0A6A7BR44_9PEZI|nr:hypothetical protein K470DRAFT_279065 [Piedraia hortae CBS 480.64]
MLKQGDPELQLEDLLEMDFDISFENSIGSMYLSMLKQTERPLIVLRNALSVSALAELLHCPAKKVNQIHNTLQPVTHVPAKDSEPITTYHLSFGDFMINLNGEHEAKFGIDVKVQIRRGMGDPTNVLEGGMYGTTCPGVYVGGRQVGDHISQAERYAARYWI